MDDERCGAERGEHYHWLEIPRHPKGPEAGPAALKYHNRAYPSFS